MRGNDWIIKKCRGITLVELLVTIAIISLLLITGMMAGRAVRKSAQIVDTLATIHNIEDGVETYSETVGQYPPSIADSHDGFTTHSPYQSGNNTYLGRLPNKPEKSKKGGSSYLTNSTYPEAWISGANLLVWALAGADLLGTPGFKDLDGDGQWWNDTGWGDDDLYARASLNSSNGGTGSGSSGRLGGGGAPGMESGGGGRPASKGDSLSVTPDSDQDGDGDAPGPPSDNRTEPLHRRYGTFIDTSAIVRMKDYEKDLPRPQSNRYSENQLFLVDGFGYPILYYRANPTATYMITGYDENEFGDYPPNPGIYNQLDNFMYTGFDEESKGLDLGAGGNHRLLARTKKQFGEEFGAWVSGSPDPAEMNLHASEYEDTFAKFIWDRRIMIRNEPVNRESYILISPGPDALWGTQDDITNFDR